MRIMLLVILFALALAACVPTGVEPAAVLPTPTPTIEIVCIRVIFEVMVSGDADVLAETEAAFLGEVTAISPTHFNQDSGAYYTDAMGIHTVTFRVIESIVDEIGLGPEVTLTVMAGSPVDNGHVDIEGGSVACYDIQVAHEFAVGQQMVVLARRGEIAWREGGRRAVLAFAAWPPYATFAADDQGLYRRENTELPPMTLEELSGYIREWRGANGGTIEP